MKKNLIKSFALVCALVFALSCSNKGTTGVGGNNDGGGGNNDGGGTTPEGKPSWFLTPEDQKKPYDIKKTLAVTLEGKAHYRITGILATKKNTLIVAYDNRKTSNADIGFVNAANLEPLVQISEDGGKTWSVPIIVGPPATSKETSHGDPVIFEAANGDIVMLAAAGGGWATAPANPSRISVIRSKDGGKTWGQWKDVQGDIFKSGEPYKAGFVKGFASSGRGTTLKDGTLACAVLGGAADGKASSRGVIIFYSKDHGETWKAGGYKVYGGENGGSGGFDEPKISAELEGGKLLISARPNNAGNNRIWLIADSVDSNPRDFGNVDVIDGNANAEGVRYTANWEGHKKNRLLLINCNSRERRKNLTIHLSEDEGKTYPIKKVLNQGSSCYSSVDVLPDGTIVTFGEETPTQASGLDRYDLVFRRFNLAWLTDGKQIYDEQY